MARAKMYCQGITKEGKRCSNWALRGNYYCQQHQNQVTKEDVKLRKTSEQWSSLIIMGILIVVFLASLAVGCEDEFLKWMTK